jgi:hypothetical protein
MLAQRVEQRARIVGDLNLVAVDLKLHHGGRTIASTQ